MKIVQGDREATCGLAVVLPDDDKITLTESPVVVDHSAGVTWNGEKLWLLRGERRVYDVHALKLGGGSGGIAIDASGNSLYRR